MDGEVIISALKIIGAVIGGALGIVGLFTNFKTENGHLSRAGIAVLVGILLSAAVGVGTSVLEGYKAKSESIEQGARTERLLHELNRTVQPITKLSATYWIRIPSGDKIVDSYIERLSAGIEARIDSLKQIDPKTRDEGLSAPAIDADGNPLDVDVDDKSDLWPHGDEAFIGLLAKFFTISISIVKDPIDPEKFAPIHGTGTVDFGAFQFFPKRSVLSWDRKAKELYIFATTEFNSELWEKTGRITSMPDLLGSQIFVQLPHSTDIPLPERYSKYRDRRAEEVGKTLTIKTLELTFAEGTQIWISGKKFKKSGYRFGNPIFNVILPSNEVEFRKFTRSFDD